MIVRCSSTYNEKKYLATVKCSRTFRAEKCLVATMGYSGGDVENRLTAVRWFVLHFKRTVGYYHNPNIEFATKCEMQRFMRLKVCLGVKHIFRNRKKCKGWSPMTPTLEIAFVWELRMFRALVGKEIKHQLRFLGHHVEACMLTMPSHCSFKSDLHELWLKEGAGLQIPLK